MEINIFNDRLHINNNDILDINKTIMMKKIK